MKGNYVHSGAHKKNPDNGVRHIHVQPIMQLANAYEERRIFDVIHVVVLFYYNLTCV